ncbi:MAG: alpha/beta hydrolase-fold protein [candidate division KSB1 bacterium]|nr:alpha/beta hydrolase-fold protein [candidate division KSB1 bacterium]MDZ7305023.1 alpha/beta hydrolase-fold protein [candidate division KSB1 bacterium]MDZ7314133.1 alpha/beta hydrolase-fold protein [candidate division KSB1 bacterium]
MQRIILAVVIFLSFCFSTLGFCQTPFKDFLARANRLPNPADKNAVIDSFMLATRFPYTEVDPASPTGYAAYFVYRGTPSSITVAGDFNFWNTSADPLQQLPATNFWYLGKNFESDARLDYKFVLNGNTWILDPNHGKTVTGGYGPNSELAMPGYVQPEEIEYRPAIAHGRIETITMSSKFLNNSRTVKIYLPPDYDTSTRRPGLIIVHDGLEYISLAYMDRVLDYLHNRREISTPIAIFIPPVNRSPEYTGSQRELFGRFIVEEVLPYVAARYRVDTVANRRANLGASAGGHITFYLAFKYPNVFGLGAGQSSYISSELQALAAAAQDLTQRFYIDVGTYDLSGFLQTNRNWRDQLSNRGFAVRYAEFHEGHSWGNWRAHLDEVLRFLFAPDTVTAVAQKEQTPVSFALQQNSPNPWSASSHEGTTLIFSLAAPTPVSLKVVNILGQTVWQQNWPSLNAGRYEVPLRAKLPPGIYFYQLHALEKVLTKKMMVLP